MMIVGWLSVCLYCLGVLWWLEKQQDMAGKSENLQKYYQQALADYEREERMRIRNEAR